MFTTPLLPLLPDAVVQDQNTAAVKPLNDGLVNIVSRLQNGDTGNPL